MTYVNGTFYGTTTTGGGPNQGTVFSFKPGGTETVLYAFQGPGGYGPGPGPQDGCCASGELLYYDGALYGIGGGGVYDDGVVFRVTLSGNETILRSFNGDPGDGVPTSGLIQSDGLLYGVTASGGSTSSGTIFSMSETGSYRVVYSFKGNRDGVEPSADLLNVGGTFYGVTQRGGYYGDGVVFTVTPGGVEQVIHSFGSLEGKSPPPGAGDTPLSSLIEVGGLLYGTTFEGGSHNGGVVFSMTLQGMDTVVHSSLGGVDGYGFYGLENGGLALYGVSAAGGSNNLGTVFRLVIPKTSGAIRNPHRSLND